MTARKPKGGPRPGAGRKPLPPDTAKSIRVTSSLTPPQAAAIQAKAPALPLRVALVEGALRDAVVPGEGGPFRPATPEHTRERDVAKGRSRKAKHKRGEEGDDHG